MRFRGHNSSIIATCGNAAGYGRLFAARNPRSLSWGAIAASAGLLMLAVPGVSFAAQKSVYLGTAGNYEILAKTGISTTGATHVTGNMGVSPITSTAITGFSLVQTAPTYSKSALVTGNIFAADYAAPTPAHLTAAIGAMQSAYANAAGRLNPTKTNLGSGSIGGLTIKPGLYKWTSNVLASTNVTLSGSATDIWIFQVAGTLNLASGAKVVLAGGALSKNIFWQVAGTTTMGTTSVLSGVLLDKTGLVMKTGAKLHGKALVQTAVTLDANQVTP
jgi:hypothetical protein